LSDVLYLIIYYVIGYRKKIVFKNLYNSFPEKSSDEIKDITKKYYRHLCDFFIEAIKTINITKKQLDRRFRYINPEVINELYNKKKDITLISGHYANWEWGATMPMFVKHTVLVIYLPLQNKISNKLINKLRSKFGIKPAAMHEIYKEILKHKERGEHTITWFLGDQRPPKRSKYWTKFMNQETAIYLGAEKIAQKLNHAVFFLDTQKIRRGYYEISFIPLFNNSKDTNEYEITEAHVRILEERIKEKPEFWLWSHNRWKHKRKIV